MNLINIANVKRKIYLFLRDNNWHQTIQTVDDFYPYFYEPDLNGDYLACDYKTRLKKIICAEPNEVKKRRSKQAWEADVLFQKRFIVDRISHFTKSPIKFVLFDIEALNLGRLLEDSNVPDAKDNKNKVSSITLYNNFTNKFHNWNLLKSKTETNLLSQFVNYLRIERPDLLLAWNINFDYNYLCQRISHFATVISPISKARYGKEDMLFPCGVSIVDMMGLFKKFTLQKRKYYALDYIRQVDLNKSAKKQVDFRTISQEIINKNIEDVKDIVDLEKKFNLISFFDEIRRLSMCTWEDLPTDVIKRNNKLENVSNNSKIVDMMILREAKKRNVVLPSRKENVEKQDYEGAYREAFKLGRHENISKVDLGSAYPLSILDFCLDIGNLRETENNKTIKIQIKSREKQEYRRTYHFEQNKDVILPSLIRNLLELKDKTKSELRSLDTKSEEYKIKEVSYAAIKAVVNTCFTPDTNILTPKGIKNIKNVEIGEKVYNVNPETLEVEIDEIIDVQKFSIKENIFHYKSKMTDLKVTKDHNFLYKQNKKIGFNTIEYLYRNAKGHWRIPEIKPIKRKSNDELISFYNIIKEKNGNIHIEIDKNSKETLNKIKKSIYGKYIVSVNLVSEEELIELHKKGWKIYGRFRNKTRKTPLFFDRKKFLSFLGWFFSEGSLYKNKKKIYEKSVRGVTNRICIFQYKSVNPVYYEEIINLLTDMGFNLSINARSINMCSDSLYEYLLKYYYPQKKIPDFIFEEPAENIKCFLDSYYKGNGNKRNIRLTVKGESLFLGLINLIVLSGNNGLRFFNDGCYRIHWNNESHSFRKLVKKEYYEGDVYCCTTKKNHTIFAGRNGNFSLTGQCYGVTGNRFFRLYDTRIAETISFLVRDLVHYIKDKIKEQGYELIYADTDAIFYNSKEDLTPLLNQLVKEWGVEKYGNANVSVEFEYEGYFEKIYIAGLCHYVGYLKTSKGAHKEIKGIEAIRGSSSKYESKFQEELIDLVLNNKSKDEIVAWVKDKKDNFKNERIYDIAFPCKLNNKEYKIETIVKRAYNNFKQRFSEDSIQLGELFHYVFLYSDAKKNEKKSVLGFSSRSNVDQIRSEIDWSAMLNRNIENKVQAVFKVMEWGNADEIFKNQLQLI